MVHKVAELAVHKVAGLAVHKIAVLVGGGAAGSVAEGIAPAGESEVREPGTYLVRIVTLGREFSHKGLHGRFDGDHRQGAEPAANLEAAAGRLRGRVVAEPLLTR